jgi:hypothetical protein
MGFLLGAVLALAAGPLCRTSHGVPCFTLTYQQSVWALVKSPVKDLVTAEVSGTMAVAQNGAFVHWVKSSNRFAVRDRKDAVPVSGRLFDPAAGRVTVIAPEALSDFRLPPLFFYEGVGLRTAAGDSGCRGMLTGIGKDLERVGNSKVLDEPVVEWKFKTAYGSGTASLAPGLDCQVLRLEAVEYRYGYVPVRKELFQATSIRRGEPDAGLFAVPAGK